MTDDRNIYGDPHNETSPVPNTPPAGINTELLKKAIDEGKQVRATALENAKQALEEAFPNKKNAIKRKLSDGGMDIFTRDKEIHLSSNEVKMLRATMNEREKLSSEAYGMTISADNQTLNLDSNEVKLVQATMNEQEKLNAEKLHGGMTKRFQKLAGITSDEVTNLASEEKLNAKKIEEDVIEKIPSPEDIEADEIDNLVKELNQEVGNDNIIITKSKVETQSENSKFLFNFREKLANYPKYLSYDGSVVLCVMLSMKDTAYPSLRNLPSVDQETIKKVVPEKYINDKSFGVVFDDLKDFILTFSSHHSEIHKITMFNTIIHPRPEDIGLQGQVKVEKDGEKICVGDKIVLNTTGIKKLIGIELKKENIDLTSMTPKLKQSVAGRNAFEIREDILEAAIDVVKFSAHESNRTVDFITDESLRVAKKFYAFVENRR